MSIIAGCGWVSEATDGEAPSHLDLSLNPEGMPGWPLGHVLEGKTRIQRICVDTGISWKKRHRVEFHRAGFGKFKLSLNKVEDRTN